MKIVKTLVNIVAMIVVTVLGMIAIWSIGIKYIVTPNSIISFAQKADYYFEVDEKLNNEFRYYLEEEKAKEIITKIPAKENIDYILNGIIDKSVEKRTENVKQEVKNIIYRSLSEIASAENVELFSKNMSEKYIKIILPTTQLQKYSELYVKYIGKLDLIALCSVVLTVIILVIVFLDKHSIKFGIIAMYNTIIFSIYIVCIILTNSSIALGDIRKVIQQMLYGLLTIVSIEIFIIILLLVVINYLLYFRKKNKK